MGKSGQTAAYLTEDIADCGKGALAANKNVIVAGLKWAPDNGPNSVIRTTRMQPGQRVANQGNAVYAARQLIRHNS